MTLVVVVGLAREARVVRHRARVVIGARGLDAALADGATGVMSFGLCGGLDPRLEVGDTVIGAGVVSGADRYEAGAAWTRQIASALPHAAHVHFAASDTIVGSPDQKAALRQQTGAGAVDMESHLVARAAEKAGIPFAIVRTVSDPAHHDLPGAAKAGFKADGRADLAAVLGALLRRPSELPSLLAIARAAGHAFKALEHAAESIAGDHALSFRPRSARISLAALWPGAPVTPPPGWVPAPQR
jgi:hopanoid-associated phosphorylase